MRPGGVDKWLICGGRKGAGSPELGLKINCIDPPFVCAASEPTLMPFGGCKTVLGFSARTDMKPSLKKEDEVA